MNGSGNPATPQLEIPFSLLMRGEVDVLFAATDSNKRIDWRVALRVAVNRKVLELCFFAVATNFITQVSTS